MPDSTVLPCCISPYNEIYGDGKKETIKEIWNSEKYKKLRLNMLNEIPSEGCSRCYQLEKSGFASMRISTNLRFKEHIPLIENTQADGALDKIDIKYIDIRFSNLCNFKCRGCGPALSSGWFEDYQALYGEKSNENKLKSVLANSPVFMEELRSLIPHAEEIYFGGGEPLITKEHFETLKLLDSNQKYSMRLSYNTNLSTLNYGDVDLAEIWSRFKYIRVGVSIDDIGPRAEYFRSGTRWEVVEKNMLKLRDNYKNVHIFVNCTVNIMNCYYVPELFEYLIENKIITADNFLINLLLDPQELSIQALPPKLKRMVKEKLVAHYLKLTSLGPEYVRASYFIRKILVFLDEKDQSHLLPVFREKTLALDKLRSEKFEEVYPELRELIYP